MPESVSPFVLAERARAARWKRVTSTLPSEARPPAPYVDSDGRPRGRYDFCLPAEYARWSLLPEVRDLALALFAELGIPWHAGIDGGPSNHLLDSQVQCVNALGQMVRDRERLRCAFGLLGVDEPLEIEPNRFMTFEYIGDVDFFDEAPGGTRVRGTMCTSVDAAFLHRNTDGVVELVLVEWKYTESYRPRRPAADRDLIRSRRYGAALHAADSPVRAELLEFSELCDEPLYQLMRQQLLAHALEKQGAHGADRVRVAHVCPRGNTGYDASLYRASQKALGQSVSEVWDRLLRAPDRFVRLDSSIFSDPAITSAEYVARYGTTSR